VVQACKFISKLLIEKTTEEIFSDFGAFWKTIINDPAVKSVLRNKNIIHMEAALLNFKVNTKTYFRVSVGNRERRRAFGTGGCRQRIVGFVGTFGEQACLEAPGGHDS